MSKQFYQSTSAHALNYDSLQSAVVYHQHRLISLGELLSTVNYLAEKIPAHQYIINLHQERYYFLLGFLLALKQKTISLFPSTLTAHTLTQLGTDYKDVLLLTDQNDQTINSNITDDKNFIHFDLKVELEHFVSEQTANNSIDFPPIESQRLVAIIFTSGSTGEPLPYSKYWADLISAAHLLGKQFLPQQTDKKTQSALVATVPAQHMYGLEASIMMALQHGLLIHSTKPFFPQDISDCLDDFKALQATSANSYNSVLITTPLHLKACIKTAVDLSTVKLIISATAPLDKSLARSCEQQFNTPVKEIFGCTEVGSMAWRRTSQSEQWTVLDDISLSCKNNTLINTSRSIKQFPFNDIVEVLDSQHFLLQGRMEDLINQAGKRTSLAYLNHHLQTYPEFADACYYQDNSLQETRLIAFVVAHKINDHSIPDKAQQQIKNKQLIAYLKARIEAVFLPKRIYYVQQLPRNATGKLPLTQLKKLFLQYESALPGSGTGVS